MREIYKKSLLYIIKNNGKCSYNITCDTCPFSESEDEIHVFCVISRFPAFKKTKNSQESLNFIKQYAIKVYLDNYNKDKEALMEILL